MVNLKVNGVDRSFDGNPDMPLLWYLRDILGLTGTKFGCGISLCGACTVHKNGEAIRSCVTTMSAVAGSEIRTIEDLGANGLHPVQQAWMQVNVPQCGYCQSGQIMQAVSLLKSKPHPSDQEIDDAMAGNICRCGTYQRIRPCDQVGGGESCMSQIENVSRRRFLKGVFGTGALILASSEKKVLPVLTENGIGVLGMKPMGDHVILES